MPPSPVNMGLNGHRLNVGEYGYMGDPRFRPFQDQVLEDVTTQSSECCLEETGIMFAESTIDHSFANSAPVVIDRPDGRLKPGELKAGSVAFMTKATNSRMPLPT